MAVIISKIEQAELEYGFCLFLTQSVESRRTAELVLIEIDFSFEQSFRLPRIRSLK